MPAALNGLTGLKPSRGLLSTRGVVPACRTLDCVTFLTQDARTASELLAHCAHLDPQDPYSRRNPAWNDASAFGAPRPFRFGLPDSEQLEFFGCPEGAALFEAAAARLRAIGGEAQPIDLSPFLEAARLLYEGPWVAERHLVTADLLNQQPDALLPVLRQILAGASAFSAADAFSAQYRLQALKARCDAQLAEVDCILTPTIGRPFTLAELAAEPIRRNSELGHYTNFMNLLDYAAVALPAGHLKNGLPWGITLFGPAFTDQYLLSLAQALEGQPTKGTARNDRARVVVCGAHLEGLPLNPQLIQRGARLVARTHTAPHYQLYALAGGPPKRPGLIRSPSGAAIAVEVWELPSRELGSFMQGIPAPLGLGKVELADGIWETGFICEPCGLEGAQNITAHGGWRAWLASGV